MDRSAQQNAGLSVRRESPEPASAVEAAGRSRCSVQARGLMDHGRRLIELANLVLNRQETRTVLRVANGWPVGPAPSENAQRAHETMKQRRAALAQSRTDAARKARVTRTAKAVSAQPG